MPLFTSIRQFHHDLYQGSITCLQTVKDYLGAIAAQNHLNAFIRVYEEEASSRAALLDARIQNGEPVGRLAGVVIAIKDVLCYKDHPVSAASKILDGFSSLYSATAIERLLQEDAIIIGHVNCDEFAMGSTNELSAYGKVLNARDTSRVPGGSSGGSAVAVQADLCMISLGSDTGGSVRQPADFCGIIGLKPTYGRISRHGLIAYASSFDQIGIFGKNIDDVALILQTIAGEDPLDSTSAQEKVPEYVEGIQSTRPLKIAWFREALEHPSLDDEIRAGIKSFFETLKAEGHIIEPVDFPLLDHIVPAYYVLTTAEASSNLARFDGVKYGYRTTGKALPLTDLYKQSRSEGFGWEVKRRIMLGTFVLSAGYYDAYYTKAQQVRRMVARKAGEVFSSYDCILLPTAPGTAFRLGEKMEDPIAMYLADIYTVFANLVGVPAISIPLFEHSNGMPFGLQVITDKFREDSLLSIADQFMKLKAHEAHPA